MQRRQPLPRLWLMTDERQGEALWDALRRLPRGSGIVFRHYGLPAAQRRLLFERVKRIARKQRLVLLLAGGDRLPGADGIHGKPGGRGLSSASAHSLPELRAAERRGTAVAFLSPVFPTNSHPKARTLGRVRFGLLARQARIPVIALGGMDERRARSLAALGAYGWGAIDAWAADQKRKAVPI
ncbi:MAG: thiamine-phosphate pyrophosphorylase [Sphingomonadales bacterium]|jgi:thiamine-phosphate pyrophosphorylase|nr:thiamine-phosphate pyrophosphorylase [Sphingomonadales bacterium]